ncbi:unnamed protein product [Fusarium langsethiae]|nr:unnamed protein product [Fusarium langsethiae]
MDYLAVGQKSARDLRATTSLAQICFNSFAAYASVAERDSVEGFLPLVAFIQEFIKGISPYVSLAKPVNINRALDPFTTFYKTSDNELSYFPSSVTQLDISPLCCAALQGIDEVVSLLLCLSDRHEPLQDDLDFALFLALSFRHRKTADLLLTHGSNPARDRISNGLHGAAYGGLEDEISLFVIEYGVDVNVEDKNGATAVMYAMGLEHPRDWEIIKHLFSLGADQHARVGEGIWTYAQYARAMGKGYLAERLAETEVSSPTQYALSRESSCTMDEY